MEVDIISNWGASLPGNRWPFENFGAPFAAQSVPNRHMADGPGPPQKDPLVPFFPKLPGFCVSSNSSRFEVINYSVDFNAPTHRPLEQAQICNITGVPEYYYLGQNAPASAFDYCETLAAYNARGAYASSGAYLEQIQNAYHYLDVFEAEEGVYLERWAAEARAQLWGWDTPPQGFNPSIFGFEEIVVLIDAANLTENRLSVLSHPTRLLVAIQWLQWTRALKERINRRIRSAKSLVYQAGSRFCGLSWSRRLWFLLHGGHPPRPESWLFMCQVFGCA